MSMILPVTNNNRDLLVVRNNQVVVFFSKLMFWLFLILIIGAGAFFEHSCQSVTILSDRICRPESNIHGLTVLHSNEGAAFVPISFGSDMNQSSSRMNPIAFRKVPITVSKDHPWYIDFTRIQFALCCSCQ